MAEETEIDPRRDRPAMKREGYLRNLFDPDLPIRERTCTTRLHEYGVYVPQDDTQFIGALDFTPVWTGELHAALEGVRDAYADGKEPQLVVRHAEDFTAMRAQCMTEITRLRPEFLAQRWIAAAAAQGVALTLDDFTYYPAERAIKIDGMEPQAWYDEMMGDDCESDCMDCGECDDEEDLPSITYLFAFKDLATPPALLKVWDLANHYRYVHHFGITDQAEVYAMRPGDVTVYPTRMETVRNAVDERHFLHYTTTVYVREALPLSQAMPGQRVDLELHSGSRLKGVVHDRTTTTLRIDTGGALSMWHVSAFKSLTRDVQIDQFAWSIDGRR